MKEFQGKVDKLRESGVNIPKEDDKQENEFSMSQSWSTINYKNNSPRT